LSAYKDEYLFTENPEPNKPFCCPRNWFKLIKDFHPADNKGLKMTEKFICSCVGLKAGATYIDSMRYMLLDDNKLLTPSENIHENIIKSIFYLSKKEDKIKGLEKVIEAYETCNSGQEIITIGLKSILKFIDPDKLFYASKKINKFAEGFYEYAKLLLEDK